MQEPYINTFKDYNDFQSIIPNWYKENCTN